jgi:hypothetical protein
MLLHKSGEYLEEVWSVPVSKQDAQGYGSALTYARRYMLQAIVGLAPIDDDAEASVGRSQPQQQQAKQDPHTVEAIKALEGVDELSAAYKAMSSSDRMLYSSVFKARKEQLINLANAQAA